MTGKGCEVPPSPQFLCGIRHQTCTQLLFQLLDVVLPPSGLRGTLEDRHSHLSQLQATPSPSSQQFDPYGSDSKTLDLCFEDYQAETVEHYVQLEAFKASKHGCGSTHVIFNDFVLEIAAKRNSERNSEFNRMHQPTLFRGTCIQEMEEGAVIEVKGILVRKEASFVVDLRASKIEMESESSPFPLDWPSMWEFVSLNAWFVGDWLS